jgi:aspartyl-tRNA(Asn)/glutamyl-tRNA(Gln) amidotransferase subunit A
MFIFSGIRNYHRQLESSRVDCVTIVSDYISRIHSNKKLNAFLEVFEQEALEKAAKLDAERKLGIPMKKLHGVVVAIKDVICYKDHKVSAASRILKDFTSLFTASALQYLIDEDAIIIGRCNCDEFAMGSSNENSAFGPVLNAANPDFVPGGSSGGNAVAVQADLCMISIGSDTGGSVRQPADFCGIIGFKPGYGRISRHGLIAYASSFDQIGIMGKILEDVALVTSIMCRKDSFDSTMDPAAYADFELMPTGQGAAGKCCYFRQMLEHPALDPEIRKTLLASIDRLRASGWIIEEIEFDLLEFLVPAYYLLTTAEAASNLSRYDGIRFGERIEGEENLNSFYAQNRASGFGKEVKRRIMLGTFVLSSGYYDMYFSKAQKVRRMLLEKTNDIFSRFDAILLPVSPHTAFRIGEKEKDPLSMYLADMYTVFANLTGIPAIALPLAKHSNGLPFGIQVMTARGKEAAIMSISKWIFPENDPGQ